MRRIPWTRAAYVRGTYAELSRTRAAVDPLTICLPAGSDYDPDGTVMDWMEGHRWPSGEPVLVPVEWVAAYHDQLKRTKAVLITPITNGLGAGFDLEHAIAHGIMELLQRDGNVVNYRALDQGVVVDTEGVTDPVILSLMQRLRADGIQPSSSSPAPISGWRTSTSSGTTRAIPPPRSR
jgi:ribosomal protein S12 methylthiotransferase accessory factor